MTDAVVTPQRAVIVLASSGSFDARARKISAGLASRGHEVTLVTRRERGASRTAVDPSGFAIRRIGRAVAPGLPTPIRQAAHLGAIVDQWSGAPGAVSPDPSAAARDPSTAPASAVAGDLGIVHVMGLLALPAGFAIRKRAGGRLVYDARDLYPDASSMARFPALVRRLVQEVEGRWARSADRVMTVNDGLADVLHARYRVERPLVILNASTVRAPGDLMAHRFHDAVGLPPATRIVLYQGGFSPGRGIDELIDAMADVPKSHLVLMGYGRLEGAMRVRLADPELAARVSILPPVPPAEILDWVACADVVAIPIKGDTLNHRLATPNKLFEALAAGVPIAASDLPGMAALVQELDAGVLFDPERRESISGAILGLLARPPEERVAARARIRGAVAGRYDWPTQFDRLLGEYTRLTGLPW